MISERKINIATLLFFITFFAIGISTFRDYGISFDEGFQRTLIGEVNYNLIKTGDFSILNSKPERYYGPAYEIVLYASEKLFKITDSRTVFLLRHLISFLTFFTATIFFYFLSLKLFKKNHIALLSCIFLVLSPRIFAEAFYNSKDLSMLCFTIIACYTMYIFVERQTNLMAIVHAAMCGFVIDIRITGVLLPIITIYFLIFQKKKQIIPILSFIIYLIFFTTIFWPFLWQNPFHNFIEAFGQMSKFPWGGTVLYFGKYSYARELPWHYLLVWIGISTPILYIILFFLGLFFVLKKTLSNFFSTVNFHPILMLAILPLIAILILNSCVYNSWRHVFFIYPFILLTAIYGLIEIKNRLNFKIAQNIFKLLIVSSLGYTLFFMIYNHPYNNVYFNLLAGKNVKQNFELDYWGLSYKKGLEYILEHDKSDSIYVYDGRIGLASLNRNIITREDRKRLFYTDEINEANYFLIDIRWYPLEYTKGSLFYKIDVDNENILEVRKLK